MIIGITEVHCPNCDCMVIADEHDCGCIFGKCEVCNTDFELDDNCERRKQEERFENQFTDLLSNDYQLVGDKDILRIVKKVLKDFQKIGERYENNKN